jgi:tetratricopeptide (TPR) repeat protein
LDSLGYAHHHLGRHTQATTCYQRALALFRDLGDRHLEAAVLTRLGDTHHASGDPAAARTAWTHALDILTDLDHLSALDVRTKLDGLDQPSAPPTDTGSGGRSPCSARPVVAEFGEPAGR